MVVDWTIDYHVQPKLSDEFVTQLPQQSVRREQKTKPWIHISILSTRPSIIFGQRLDRECLVLLTTI